MNFSMARDREEMVLIQPSASKPGNHIKFSILNEKKKFIFGSTCVIVKWEKGYKIVQEI